MSDEYIMHNHLSHNESYQLLYPLEFCVFDLESTGGNPKSDRIIEIGLVKIVNLKIVETKNYLINPEREIPDFIQKLTNIHPEDVVNSPKIEEVIDDILTFIGDSILVAHNTAFDIPFLNAVLERLGKPTLSNKSLCTNLMTKYMIPNLMSTNLQYMSQIFGFGHENAHRALDDAEASAQLLLKYLDVFISKKINKVNSLYYPKNKFELDRIHLKAKDYPSLEVLFDALEHVIENIQVPFVVTMKGNEGLMLKTFPSDAKYEQKKMILDLCKNVTPETITVKLSGPFFEGLLESLSLYPKLSETNQQELISYLLTTFFKDYPLIPKDECQKHLLSHYIGDFLLFNHLIPGQVRIVPVDSLYQKLDSVLRYPGHANKLLQYLGSKMSRISQGRLKRDSLPTEVKQLLIAYVQHNQKMNHEVFVMKKIFNKKDFEAIKDDLDKFIEKNPNNYGYPRYFL